MLKLCFASVGGATWLHDGRVLADIICCWPSIDDDDWFICISLFLQVSWSTSFSIIKKNNVSFAAVFVLPWSTNPKPLNKFVSPETVFKTHTPLQTKVIMMLTWNGANFKIK